MHRLQLVQVPFQYVSMSFCGGYGPDLGPCRSGVCTMDPTLGKWLKTSLGWELAPHMNGDTMKLDVMLKALAPEALKAISQRHDAGCDARLHVALFRAIENMLVLTIYSSKRGTTNSRKTVHSLQIDKMIRQILWTVAHFESRSSRT